MAPKALAGYLDNGHGEPLAGIPAVVTKLADGAAVTSGVTDANGQWTFSGLPTADEYLITLSDTAGNSVSRAPWSGEMREAWIRDRLDVAGLPVVLDPAAGNALAWSSTGLYAPTGITLAAADLRYEPLDSAYTKTESDARYPQKTDIDPFPQYLTPLEATGLYEPLDSAYTKSEDDARFVQLTGGSVMTGLLGPTTTNTRDLGTSSLRWRTLYTTTSDVLTSLSVNSRPVIMAGCRVYHNAGQSINTGATNTFLTFNSERYDTDNFHDTVTNNQRITVPTGFAGKYFIYAMVGWAGNATGRRSVGLRVGGTTTIALIEQTPPDGAAYAMPVVSCVYDLADTNYVEVIVNQVSGGALSTVTGANYCCEFGLQRIG